MWKWKKNLFQKEVQKCLFTLPFLLFFFTKRNDDTENTSEPTEETSERSTTEAPEERKPLRSLREIRQCKYYQVWYIDERVVLEMQAIPHCDL